MPPSNTKECFREFVGQRLVGLLFDALPFTDANIAMGTKTMVFQDGRGLTIADNGSFWISTLDEVRRAIDLRKTALEATQAEIAEVLALAGSPLR